MPRCANESVLHRIEMDIYNVGAIITLVTDEVFPKPVLPTRREISIVARKRPDHVKVVGKDHMGVNGKGMSSLHPGDRLEEHVHRPWIIKQRPAPMRDSSEEVTHCQRAASA